MTDTASIEAPGELDAYKVAYGEAVRAIEGQRSAVDEIRTRSGILITAAALIASFLGPSAIQAGTPTILTWVAGGLLITAVVPVVIILWPTGGWQFSIGSRNLLRDYIEAVPPASMAELYRSLAWWLEVDWTKNQERLLFRYRLFGLSAAALVGETIALLISIATRAN